MDGDASSAPKPISPEPSDATSSAAPGRIMGLDPGDRRIGVAVTDPLGYTAQPLMTIYRKTPRADVKSIARLVRKHGVAELVVGKPLHMSGESGRRAQKAEMFAAMLRAEVPIPVYLHDERLTTWEAHQLVGHASGRDTPRSAAGRRARKPVIDQAAAVLILEGFLAGREASRPDRAPSSGEGHDPAEPAR